MDIIRRLREAKGWSQEELAAAADVGRATIQRVERGRVVPSRETLRALASALDVDARHLVQRTGLVRALTQVMQVTLKRDPSVEELRVLPSRSRALFESFCDARRELGTATQSVVAAAEEVGTAFASSVDGAVRTHEQAVRAISTPNVENFEAFQECRDRSATAHSAVPLATKRLINANERFNAANSTYTATWLALSEHLMRFV